MMRGYSRADMYRTVEDSDEYEEDGEDQEEGEAEEGDYEQEEEDPKPTKEELEYLKLRERLKETVRKQMKKDSVATPGQSQDKKKKLPYDNYGSFFGPSKPVIAQRVIQESKSILENQHLTPRLSHSHHSNKKSPAAATAETKAVVRDQRPKVVNELKVKVQKLKDTRDYSFLLSDDAELPAPTREPPSRNFCVPNSDARSVQMPSKSMHSMSKPSRPGSSGREERKPISTNHQMHPKAGSHKVASKNMPNPTLADPRKQLGSNMGNGPGRPAGLRNSTSADPRRQPGGNMGNGPGRPAGMPNSTSSDPRKQLGSNMGYGPGRPAGPKGLPSKVPAPSRDKKAYSVGVKNTMVGVHKASLPKLQSSVQKQQSEQRREFREPVKAKVVQKQPVSSSKPQIKPPKQISSHATMQEYRPKKKPVRQFSDDDEDGEQAISMIRKMFGYNPKKYAGVDDDDTSDMEANFDDILKEERISAKIAREEDERELLLIEEEERRERLRAKKRKLIQR